MQGIYKWQHHNAMPFKRREWLNERLLAHDWEAFSLARELYGNTSEYRKKYFPDNIEVIQDDGTTYTTRLTEETIYMITHVDYSAD